MSSDVAPSTDSVCAQSTAPPSEVPNDHSGAEVDRSAPGATTVSWSSDPTRSMTAIPLVTTHSPVGATRPAANTAVSGSTGADSALVSGGTVSAVGAAEVVPAA